MRYCAGLNPSQTFREWKRGRITKAVFSTGPSFMHPHTPTPENTFAGGTGLDARIAKSQLQRFEVAKKSLAI